MLNKMENENTEEVVVVEEQEEEIIEPQEEQEEDKDQKAERAQSQIDRLKKERDEAKAKLSQYESGDKKEVSGSDHGLLGRLEARGVFNKEDQAFLLRFARDEQVDAIDALEDSYVKDRLDYFKKQREIKASTFTAPNRTGTKVDEVARAVARYKKDGSLPDNNPALTSKVLDSLR